MRAVFSTACVVFITKFSHHFEKYFKLLSRLFSAFLGKSKGWFTLATESEAESETEAQGTLRSSVNLRNGIASGVGSSTESESEGSEEFLFLPIPLPLPSLPIQ